MQNAILTVSSLSLVCCVTTLIVMVKAAKELKNAKTQLEHEVEVFKEKTDRNVARIRSTIQELEV